VGGFFNWGELRDLWAPGSVAASVFIRDSHRSEGDDRVYEAFLTEANDLDFAFVYFGHTDEAGHAAGWMSEPYLAAATNADRWVGEIVARHPEAFVIIMSDHGGHDRTHGTELKEDMEIPLIVNRRVNLPESPMIYHIPSLFARELDFAPEREWESVA
jgi:predicted AlkP superfamily pyrophosphatase or phosphodiesterase